MKRRLPLPNRRQRGVASLVVVMVLFFIVSMVAAYTSRNLIFEQRTSTNQYRSTQAMEAAEAGLEWAKGLLNHGRITASCQTSASTADTSFRQRYLDINPATGTFTPRTIPATTTALTPTCVFNGATWDCNCPSDTTPSLTAPSGDAVRPAFRVRFVQGAAPPPGVVRIEVVGCTRLDEACLGFPPQQGLANEGRAVLYELVALASGLASPPMAALTAGRNVDMTAGGAALIAYNTSASAGGVTIQAGGTANGNLLLESLPGTPGDESVVEDDTTLSPDANRMFAASFNMWPATYRAQPAALSLACGVSGCTAAAVRTALAMNPGRVLWIPGDLVVDSAGDIGSATAPAMLVVDGDLRFPTAATIHGVVYLRTPTWSTSGSGGQIQGAVIAQRDVGGNGSTTVVYNPQVLSLLRLTTGSIVRVPGGWRDFP